MNICRTARGFYEIQHILNSTALFERHAQLLNGALVCGKKISSSKRYGLRIQIEKCSAVIVATSIIHNKATDYNEQQFENDEEVEQMEQEPLVENDNVHMNAVRQTIVNKYSYA